jgi:hypothetical protein
MPNEICILCGKETTTDINTHVDFRTGYIEGAGQLCVECYLKGDSSSREQITIPKNYINRYPNDMELGSKVREHYYSMYNIEPTTKNSWVCSLCGEDTSNIDYDYLSGTDHIDCHLNREMKVD